MIIQCRQASKLLKIIILQSFYILLFSTAADITSQNAQTSAIFTTQPNYDEKLFETIPSTIINLVDLNSNSTIQTSNSEKIQTYMAIKSEQFNIIYVASLQGGFFVVDLQKNYIIQQFSITCKKIFLRKDRIYASRGKEGYTIYQINTQSGLLNKICDAKIKDSVDSIYVDSKGEYIYIGSEGFMQQIKVILDGTKTSDYVEQLRIGGKSGDTNHIYSLKDESYLFLANYSNGVSIFNIKSKDKPYLVAEKLPRWQVVDLCIVENGKYIYAIEEWYGVFIGDFSLLYKDEALFKSKDDIWDGHVEFHTIARAISVSSDEKLLFIGLRSIGVSIFDISKDKLTPILINNVQMDGLANHIFLFNKDTSFLYSNGCCISIFNQLQANYNTDIPNVFNTHISRFYQYWSEKNTWPWDYAYSNSSQYIYLASAYEGLQIYEIQKSVYQNPKKIFSSNLYTAYSTDTLAIVEEKSLLIQGSSEKGLIFWDISNLSQIKKVADYNYPLANSDSDGIVYNKKLNCLAVANGYQGAYLLNITDLKNLTKISEINIIDFGMQVTAETVQITSEATHLVVSLRYYGILVFDLKYLKSPNLVSSFHTYGGEKCILSYDENYIFVSDSFNGLTIINFKNKSEPFIQQNINPGFQVQYTFQSILNPNILYLSLIENGQLALIDFTDKSNPFILAKVQYGNERCIALKEAPNKNFISYLTSDGLRIQSIKFSFKIHTQVCRINKIQQNQTTSSYTIIDPKQPLKVGQTIQFFFSSILFENDIKLKQIFYYRDYQISRIESWMKFYSSKNSFLMVVDKTAIANSNGSNIILLQIISKLNPSSFVQSNYGLNVTQSKEIFNKLKQIAVLNNENFVNLSNFEIDSNFSIDLDNPVQYQNLTQVQDFIQQILLESIYYQPIKFTVISSLDLNINYVEENAEQPIQTLSQSVKIIIKLIENSEDNLLSLQIKQSNYFVESSSTQAALINISQDFKQINIEGSTPDVNEVLIKGIQIVVQDSQIKNIKFQITMIDEINYDFSKVYQFNQLKFLKNTQQSKLENTLQEQFQSQIAESITVQKDYKFTFTSNTFQYLLPSMDNVDYTVKIYILLNEKIFKIIKFQLQALIRTGEQTYKNISSYDWIEFDSSKRKFQWYGGFSLLSEKFIIVVNATTSSYWAVYEFEIHFERIPVGIIVIICLTSFVFTLIIVLLYCYRSHIQHIRYFDKYTYQSESAFVNKQFSKIIMLIPCYLGEFHKLWDRFIRNEKKVENKSKINFKKYLNNQKEIDISLLLEKLKEIYESNKHFFSKLKEEEFKMSNTRLQYLTKGAFAFYMIKQDQATYEVYLQLKQIAKKKGYRKDWYKYYSKIIYAEKGSEKLPVLTIEESNSYSNIESYHMSQMDQNFPMIFVDESKILFTLEEANSTSAQKNESFNHYLLFENIKAVAHGYTSKSIIRKDSSYGETIHIQPSKIKKIVAFNKCDNESKCFNKLQKKYLLNFRSIQGIKNSSLPEWLKCDISEQSICFSGKPNSSDVCDILIRIYDNNNYILNQFFINVRKIRKQQAYQNGDPDLNQIVQQQQMIALQNFSPPLNRIPSQNQTFTPSKILSSGGFGVTGCQFQTPQLMTNSPTLVSLQILSGSNQKRLNKSQRHNTQKHSIKQYKQLINGVDGNQLKFRSENQIKDTSLVEVNKKNSDDIDYNCSFQSPVHEDLEKNIELSNQDKLSNCSSNQIFENQHDRRANEDNIFIKQLHFQNNNIKDSNNQLLIPGSTKNKQTQNQESNQGELYSSQNKVVPSSKNSKIIQHKHSFHFYDAQQNSLNGNQNENSQLEKSDLFLSQNSININSPIQVLYNPISINALNMTKFISSENLNKTQ